MFGVEAWRPGIWIANELRIGLGFFISARLFRELS